MIVVGEKINASRQAIKEFIEARNSRGLVELAREQISAGADYVDINVGTGTGSRDDEVQTMKWLVQEIAGAVEKPLCIDSADPMVLHAGLETVNNEKALINSVKAEDDTLDEVAALAAKYGCLLVGLAMDESGIPSTVQGRIEACRKIARACTANGVPLENLFFDPLVLPVSADVTQGLVTLEAIRNIKAEFPAAKTIMGLSNVSFGLPARSRLNRAFLHMAAYAGLDAIIADPLDRELMAATRTAKVLLGKDRHCRGYTRAFRN